MDIRNVTKEDATACAQLIRVIIRAKFDGMTAEDAQALVTVKTWVNKLATTMAADLKAVPTVVSGASTPADGGGMKIKAMGPIGSSKPTKKKK